MRNTELDNQKENESEGLGFFLVFWDFRVFPDE